MNQSSPTPKDSFVPWYKTMTGYHWFVFLICSLGWAFDCFDQQLFALVRNPALADLLGLEATHPQVIAMGGYATSLMLIGWATGGILFGVMGDKLGRAKTMILTILVYATFTGMSGFATGWIDFLLYRFLTGLGIGGQFAAGVTLLAETMPDRARPKTLGMLQIVAAFGNMLAGILVMLFSTLQQGGMLGGWADWRILFFIGFLPAILAIFVMKRLEEPEKWKEAIATGGVKKAGSIPDLFRDPRWRYNVIVGMLLATCGVIGLWGIGFFSFDLTRTAFRNNRKEMAQKSGDIKNDFELVRMLVAAPKDLLPIALEKKLRPEHFIGEDSKSNDPGAIFLAITKIAAGDPIEISVILSFLDDKASQSPQEKERRAAILAVLPAKTDTQTFTELTDHVITRAKSIDGYVSRWGGLASLLFNLGAIFGTFSFTVIAERFGRRPAFTIAFSASLLITILVFLTMRTPLQVLWMTPLLGCCTLSLFGGYAIYFPELFPTHLRSTAVSFCYNIGRFAAATGPAGLGLLTTYVFHGHPEPIRMAGAAMSITFVFGIICTWFGPETKGKPLPE